MYMLTPQACTWALGGYEAQVRDPSTEQRAQWVDDEIATYKNMTTTARAENF
ncbi:uncharacterized protein M421DRAFT_425086 [Didymella exigua CBS 183.55]|uniref:Uncharacterized protein n=1 Tax=Didymella exigua CBS 183.55 TaxID=1150837 RepID=A0A6A5R9R2_9PLEO|nr:uncharacterized protein M421DRAFT_425086 [Didymella exigua CBS 183.55]KAF1924069.1 hypothetical protein M421DRAFT_425086 [Didymella exigua CBS 183.55]